jgi:hypothetical protein
MAVSRSPLSRLLAQNGHPINQTRVWLRQPRQRPASAGQFVLPLMRELAGDRPPPSIEQAAEAFDIHGLVIPRGDILL